METGKNAKFISKTYGKGYDRDFVYLEYEYRGQRYTVHENRAKGNEPLSWQHRNEQSRIDTMLDRRDTSGGESWEIGFNLFWDYVEGKNVEEENK